MTVAATWPLGCSMAVLVTGCGVLRMTGQVGGCGHTVADVGGVAGFHLAAAVSDRTAARLAEAVTELSVRKVMAGVRCGHDRTG
jgi:hypothetical protein